MPSRWAKTGTRASACTRPTSPLPPRGTITSMNSVIVSIAPTAARSVVGTSWIAASGSPAAFSPATRPAWIACAERRLSEPPRRIAAFPAFRQSAPASAVTFGPALEDHADHPERRPHPPDVQPRGPVPLGDHLPDGSGWSAMARSPSTIACTRAFVEPQPVEHRRRQAARGGVGHVVGVGREQRRAVRPDRVGRGAQRRVLLLGRREGELVAAARAARPIPRISAPTSTRSSIALSLRSPGRRGAPAPPGPRGRAGPRSVGPVPHDHPRLARIIAREPLGDHRPVRPGHLDRVAAADSPSTALTPAGSRDLPRPSAATAPASTVTRPRGFIPEIQRLRAACGSPSGSNQVQRAPATA